MPTKGRIHPRSRDGGGYWRWLHVDHGTKYHGWIAGPLHIVPVHPGKPSIVCVKELSNGESKCPHCGPSSDVKDLGYQPVYTDISEPCVLTVHPHQFEPLDRMRLHLPVQWGRRGGDDAESTWVLPHLGGAEYQTTLEARRQPADVTIAIARYWKRADLLPILLRWFGSAQPVPPEPPVVAAAPRQQHERPRTTAREAIEGMTGEPLADLISAAGKRMLANARNRERSVERNGKHG